MGCMMTYSGGPKSLSAYLILLGLSTRLATAAPELLAGAARIEITPDPRLTNWVTQKPYGQVLDPVFGRAIVLAQGDSRIAIVSWDLLYPMEGAVADARRLITRETGIPETNVLISATHNHSAPWSPILTDPLTSRERRVVGSMIQDPLYLVWTTNLLRRTANCVRQAAQAIQPATLALGRAYVGDLIFNRRPIKPDGTVQSTMTPQDPYALPAGLRFGRVNPTLTLLLLQGKKGQPIAVLFSLACHAVCVYPDYDGISADWPGAACAAIHKELGGEVLFLQGCAGDVVPIRRGLAARDELARAVAMRATNAAKHAHQMDLSRGITTSRAEVKAPVEEAIRSDLGRDFLTSEVQVLAVGEFAIATLPGEPLTMVGLSIEERSPFPHTLVAGYCSGYGVQYVGMPGDKARGGYEMGSRNLGTDGCGQLLIDAVVSELRKAKDSQVPAPSRQ